MGICNTSQSLNQIKPSHINNTFDRRVFVCVCINYNNINVRHQIALFAKWPCVIDPESICLHQECPEKQLTLNGNLRRWSDVFDRYTAVFHPLFVYILSHTLTWSFFNCTLVGISWTMGTNFCIWLKWGLILIRQNKWYAINNESNNTKPKHPLSCNSD